MLGNMATMNGSKRHAGRHDGDGKSTTLYDDAMPPFAETELPRLYGSAYAAPALWRAAGMLDAPVHTYVVRRGDAVETLLVYRMEGRVLRVLNEGIRLDHATVSRFAECVFAAHPKTDAIVFHAVWNDLGQLTYPVHAYNCLEDIVLDLPATTEQYLAALGGSTRSYIKRYLNKLKRDFPEFTHEVQRGEAIDEQVVRAIVDMNRARMRGKGKEGVGNEEVERILRTVRECGMVSVLRIGGRVCAGTINYEVGANTFLDVISHDPSYDDYRLGTLNCYLTICECIARGAQEYHFLWGRHDYKFRLLGKQRDLDHVTLYRSRAAQFRHAGLAWRDATRDWKRRAELWFFHARKNKHPVAKFADMVLQTIRGAGRVS